MNILWLLALFAAAGGLQGKTVKLTAAADIAGWIESGSAQARLPPAAVGGLKDLFDGNPETFMRCGEKGRAVFTFFFRTPLPVKQVGVDLGGSGVHRWRVEISRTPDPNDGPSFEPLVPWRYLNEDRRDPVAVPGDWTATGLKIIVERLTLGPDIFIREIEFYTTLELTRLELVNFPGESRVGGAFRLQPVGIDRFGGRLTLDDGVRWRAHPKEVARIVEGGVCLPLASGKAAIGAVFNGLRSPDYVLTIAAPDPPPSDLSVVPFPTSVAIRFKGCGPSCRSYALFMREEGLPSPIEPSCITGKEHCTVFGLESKKAYLFSAAGLDASGFTITSRSKEVRVRTLPVGEEETEFIRIAHLTVLVPIYSSGFGPGEVEAVIEGLELARLFIFRHSKARLNLDLQYLILPEEAPGNRGGDLAVFERDLGYRGVLGRNFEALHIIAANLEENCSGYFFSNGAVGSLGHTAEAPYPGTDPEVDYRACWTFVHEFQHSLDSIVHKAPQGGSMLTCHFLDNYPLPEGEVFDAGDFYDGIGEILRRFEGYLSLPPPWTGYLETVDADADGMPDEDSRLPWDEARFGSDPDAADTDGDGRDDLAEFCAGLYSGADPRVPDTDGDAIPDGLDEYPLSDFSGVIPFGTLRKGEIPENRLSKGAFFDPAGCGKDLTIHASWDNDRLYFTFTSTKAFRIVVHIDGSGHLGPFESDRMVAMEAPAAQGGDVYTREAALEAAFGNPYLYLGENILGEGWVQSMEKEGGRVLWVAVPAALGKGTGQCHVRNGADPAAGLTLEEGRVLGLSFTFYPLVGTRQDQDEKQLPYAGSVYENHRFYDAVLSR